ncbi:MAG: SWIM zinc finger family protein [Actinobacteria bacterium]|nr:SWIM zinc finger family protein [Actinomycetota bacterium]
MAVQFGHTWWGRAWVDALEQRARVDPNRLARGRTYARQDRVTSLAVERGRVLASVRGSRRLDYRTRIDVRTYGDDEWARVVDAIAGRAGHTAALLDGELEPGVVDDAREAGVELLPSRGDLKPHCSCPDDAVPCKHAAAVCYLVAEVLDDDPFTLFALRGRSKADLLAELREARRRGGAAEAHPDDDAIAALAATGPQGTGADPGMVARLAWSRELAPLPPVPDLPAAPGTPASWPDDPPVDAPFDPPGLLVLATDAARRAWRQVRGDADSALALDRDADRARREAEGATVPAGPAPESTAAAPAPDLTHRALAWRHGGEAGLAVLDEAPWRPPLAAMAAARAAVEEAGVSPSVITVSNNRITGPGFQLRLSRAGAWWRFEKRKGRWEVAAPPAEAPDDLLAPG